MLLRSKGIKYNYRYCCYVMFIFVLYLSSLYAYYYTLLLKYVSIQEYNITFHYAIRIYRHVVHGILCRN